MLDGRHTGTGGGNHVVLGGADAGRQPVPAPARSAREPGRLLAQPPVAVVSVLGPVHRPDQPGAARRRGAPRQRLRAGDRRVASCPGAAQYSPPWLVDRVFRHLLVDVTGNTHRAEFCIDKLYSPDSASGRLGLVELRAFEMPPHARMSLVAAAAACARSSRASGASRTTRPLIRWGTELHDRFMLPYFVRHDFDDVIDDLRRRGFGVRRRRGSRRTSSSASRSPARSRTRGVELELRQALEPWHVLGEEGAARRHGALRRFVGRAAAGAGRPA